MPTGNFLSITFDDMNAFAFLKSLYGGQLQTPNIDRLMAMGTTFENAYAQVAVCNASRTSALSGLNPGLTGVHHNDELWSDYVTPALTLPGVLNSAGFDTSVIGKVFHSHEMTPDVAAAIADFVYRPGVTAFETPDGFGALSYGPSNHPIEQQPDWLSVERAIARLDDAGNDPFAMFLGIVKPHLDWVVPQEFFDLYPVDQIVLPFTLDGDLSDVPEFMRALVYDDLHGDILDAGAWQEALQGYFASISFADAMLGRVLDALEENGQLETTTILLWTDHGFHLGDKDNWFKFTLWEEAARAPFVLVQPGAADDGQRVSQPVELVDMMPTVLDLLGVNAPNGLSGRSLRAFLDDPTLTDGGVAVTTMYGSAAIRDGNWRYIRYADGSTELYDLANDPNQWTNLAGSPGHAALQDTLHDRLEDELEADGWQWVEAGDNDTGSNGDDSFVLVPGAGIARGRDGDDTYFISHGAAYMVEADGEGHDRVFTYASYTLPDGVEDLFGVAQATIGRLTLTGNELANHITGYGTLSGRGGDDLIELKGQSVVDGGDGDDAIRATNGRDTLAGGSGDDTIRAGGNSDVVSGGDGDDFLLGQNGNDTLDGGAGRDRMLGGIGNDTYVVGVSNEIVIELAGEGIDTIETALARYTLRANMENLTGTSPTRQILTGNELTNVISGGDGNDTLASLAGIDVLKGGNGNDTLDGGLGDDRMTGGAGSDTYLVDSVGDSVAEAAHAGTDTVKTDLAAYTLGVNVENLTGTAGTGQALTGNAENNVLAGADGDDRLDGGAGSDRMSGGLGDDSYRVDSSGDVVTEIAGGGTDAVRTTLASYALGANVENLTGTSAGGQALIGNGGANVIVGAGGGDSLSGGDGDDLLDGNTGSDTLEGGGGSDVFLFRDGDFETGQGFAAKIVDFRSDQFDLVDLALVDADTTRIGDQAFTFIGTAGFSGAAGELQALYVAGDTLIMADTDGDRLVDSGIWFTGTLLLTESDFVL